jgi:hypothetical protein
MDIHTDISPVLSLIPPTLTIVAQVLPLPWKVTYTSATSYSLTAERKVDLLNLPAGEKPGYKCESWKVHCVIVMDEVRIVLQVGTHVMDNFESNFSVGWTNLTTATPSRPVLRAQLEKSLTDEGAAHAVTSVIDELVIIMQERRDAIRATVFHD